MTKKFDWLNKHKEALRELEAESEEARYANRHVIADLKRTIKNLTKEKGNS